MVAWDWPHLLIVVVALNVLVALLRHRSFVEIRALFFRITIRDDRPPDTKKKPR